MRDTDAGRARRAVGPSGTGLLLLLLHVASGVVADTPDAPDAPEMPDAEIVSPSRLGEVRFPHLLHAEEMGLDCSECHHETAASGLGGIHADYFGKCRNNCSACHEEGDTPKAPQSCSGCHPTGATVMGAEALSAKVAIHRSCWSCHDSGTGAEATSSCGFCHTGLPAGREWAWTAAAF